LEIDTWMPISFLNDTLAQIIQRRLQPSSEIPSVPITWARSNPAAILATGRYSPLAGPVTGHPGWRHCSPRQIQLAKDAAAVDARVALLSQVSYCKVGGNRELGFALKHEKRLRAVLSQLLRQWPVGEPILEPTGICQARASITQSELTRLLQQAVKDIEDIRQPDLYRSLDAPVSADLTAEGFAIAPPTPSMFRPPNKRTQEAERPEWSDRFLLAQGSGKAPADITDAANGRDWAERAARIEANRQLWMQIEELPISDAETIGMRLAKDQNTASSLAGLTRFVAGTESPLQTADGTVTVSVGIHLRIVWRTLSTLDQR
jgi:hypothetical protein